MVKTGESPSHRTVRFHAAIEDDDGYFLDEEAFKKPAEAVRYAKKKNQHEVNRFSPGQAPDTEWFVMRVLTELSVYKRVPIPDQTNPRPMKTEEQKSVRRRVVHIRRNIRAHKSQAA